MMKKLMYLAVCAAVVLGLTGCPSPDSEQKPQVDIVRDVDFRNKNPDGTVLSRMALKSAVDVTFSFQLLDKLENFEKPGNTGVPVYNEWEGALKYTYSPDGDYFGVEPAQSVTDEKKDSVKANYEKMINNLKFEDDPENDCIKLVFTTPDGWEKINYWDLTYIDAYGNKSTSVENDDVIDENGTLSVKYPLVIPGKEARFFIQLGYLDSLNGNKWFGQLYASVIPAHGKGCIDDLYEGFSPYNYMEITNDGKELKVKQIIPPMAQNLEHFFQVLEKKVNSRGWENYDTADISAIGVVLERAKEAEIQACEAGVVAEFTLNLEDYLIGFSEADYAAGSKDYCYGLHYDEKIGNYKDYPYIFAWFKWHYTLEDFPGYKFGSPWIISETVPNKLFIKAQE